MAYTEKQKLACKRWYEKHKEAISEKRRGTRNEACRQYYIKNRERLLAQQKEWAKQNPDKVKKALQKYRDSNKERRLYWNIKSRALKRNIEFDLDITDIIIPDVCPYLQVPLIHKDKNFTPSIDRIDNTKGYIKGNIEVISLLANKMKNIATIEQLKVFSKSIIDKYKDYS